MRPSRSVWMTASRGRRLSSVLMQGGSRGALRAAIVYSGTGYHPEFLSTGKLGRMTLAAQFQIEYLQYLGPDGKPVTELPQAFRDPAALVPLFKQMLYVRTFDA